MLPLALVLAPLARADVCMEWSERTQTEVRDAPMIDESSGVAPSLREPGAYYTIDDSGGPADVYTFREDGTSLGTTPVRGATNVDWEDIAAGPCPGARSHNRCLYIGDIGDNRKQRDHVVVYVVPEPAPGLPATALDSWKLTYPTGPQNAETLLVHPLSGAVYIVTKDDKGFSDVFRVPAGVSTFADDEDTDVRAVAMLEPVARLSLKEWVGRFSRKLTGGDFDLDGDRLVMRTYSKAWEWPVDPCHPEAHWSSPPHAIDTGRHVQAEAITYASDGGIITTSEGLPMPITHVTCLQRVPETSPCGPEETR